MKSAAGGRNPWTHRVIASRPGGAEESGGGRFLRVSTSPVCHGRAGRAVVQACALGKNERLEKKEGRSTARRAVARASVSCRVERPRMSQLRRSLPLRDAAEHGQVDLAAKKLGEVHLEAAEGEQPCGAGRVGLHEDIDVAVGAEPIGEDGAEEVGTEDTGAAAGVGDAGEVELEAVEVHSKHIIRTGTRGRMRVWGGTVVQVYGGWRRRRAEKG